MKPVLVVEDDEDVREAIVESLMLMGQKAVGVADGRAALDWLQSAEKLPSVIVLDLMMPRMDGFEFREKQLEDPRLAGIPVVVLSADRTTDQKAKSMQADGFARKPVGIADLMGIAEKYRAE